MRINNRISSKTIAAKAKDEGLDATELVDVSTTASSFETQNLSDVSLRSIVSGIEPANSFDNIQTVEVQDVPYAISSEVADYFASDNVPNGGCHQRVRSSSDVFGAALISGTKCIRGVTFYVITVSIEDKSWELSKRYSDFVRLDSGLAACGDSTSRGKLPEKGLIGFRKALNIGSFKAKRLQGLTQYLDELMREAMTSRQTPPHLKAFLGGEGHSFRRAA